MINKVLCVLWTVSKSDTGCTQSASYSTVTEILVLEILVPRTKIFAGKYGPPLEKSVRVEDPHFRPSSQTREYKTTAN